MAAAALRVAVALGLFRRAAGVGEFQDCIACGSNNLNWKDMDHCERFEPLSQIVSSSNFEGRHGHASVVFPYNDRLALWVVGGRGIAYEKWNFEVTHRRADVWVYIVEDQRWLKMENLEGDFFARTDEAFLMEDVLDPGDVAPFWERFGHSLDVFPALNVSATTGEVMGKINAMVLLGGFTPRPDNDVWMSKDGIRWFRVGYAPWTGRGYHATAVFRGRLYVMGGSPLTNDVWAGDFNTTGSVETPAGRRDVWRMSWEAMAPGTGSFEAPETWSILDDARWSPRAGHGATVQFSIRTNESRGETLYLTGGLASWPEGHPLEDGYRGTNDVWKTEDGANWTRVVRAAPWAARAWHSLITWTDLTDVYADVSLAARQPNQNEPAAPRIWLAGGGYVGKKGNSVVEFVDAYYDLWWSRDGATWTQVGSSEGAGDYLCSSLEVFKLDENNYVGKYSHTMVPFWQIIPDAQVCETVQYNQYGFISGCDALRGADSAEGPRTNRIVVPALYFIGGDPGYLNGQKLSPSKDVYVSRAPVLCEVDGHKCPTKVRADGGGLAVETFQYDGVDDSYRSRVNWDGNNDKSRGGFCPDPMAACPDGNLATCSETQEQVTFYVAANNTGDLEYPGPQGYAPRYSIVNTDNRFAYTVYNITEYGSDQRHPLSMAGMYVHEDNETSYLQGFVARLEGCRCAENFEGEYCESGPLDAARRLRPRAAAAALALLLARRA